MQWRMMRSWPNWICNHLRKARRHHGTTPPILAIAAHDPKRSRRTDSGIRFAAFESHHPPGVSGGSPPTLTARGIQLLLHFSDIPAKFFSRRAAGSGLGHPLQGYEHTVNSHINRLRAKLDKIAPSNKLIHPVGLATDWALMPLKLFEVQPSIKRFEATLRCPRI